MPAIDRRRGYVERKQTKMMETQPCMVSFHLIDEKKGEMRSRTGVF